jgi:hypothetical protein
MTVTSHAPTSTQPMIAERLDKIEQLTANDVGPQGMAAIVTLIVEVRRLRTALHEACEWASCESGEGIIKQRAAVARLRALAGG